MDEFKEVINVIARGRVCGLDYPKGDRSEFAVLREADAITDKVLLFR
jgi:hypothetical protein